MLSTFLLALTFPIIVKSEKGGIRRSNQSNLLIDSSPLEFFVSTSGSDKNDGISREKPFLTLSKATEAAISSNAKKRGGSITLMKGRYTWLEEDGIVNGLVGPSSEEPFFIKADDIESDAGEHVLLDGSDILPPLSEWTQQQDMFCTKPSFHPLNQVNELWFNGIESITGGEKVLGIRAQHPNVLGGDRDSPEAWPIPPDPMHRDYPLPGSIWDKSARLGNNEGNTLGLIDCSEVVLSPPPKCFQPLGYDLKGDRCTNGCQQITGNNVEKAEKRCFNNLPDCPERYHEAFVPHPKPKNTNFDMNDCPSAFPSCDRSNLNTWPWCLDLHNIGYVLDPKSKKMDYSSNGGEIYVTACVDKKLLGPFPIVAHDTSQGKIYFNYTDFSVNKEKPAKDTALWQSMTSCWKMDADKIEDITDGAVKTDYFRMEEEPKYKVISRGAFDNAFEWWHDGPGERLCVNLEDLSKTSGVRVKQRGSMIRLQGSENVKVSGLKLFATEFHAESENGIGFSNTFDKMLVEYPDEIHLNPAAIMNSVIRYGKGIIRTTGPVADSNEKPTRCIFTNNLIEYGEMGVELTDCAGADIIRNTIHHIYNGDAFEIYKHGCECEGCKWDHDKCAFEVAYNRIYDVGFNGHCDCSGIQTKFGAVKEMQLHHNWIYSLPYHKGIRLDTGENGAHIYENMIWNTAKGGTFKGGTIEGNRIVQNTAFGSKDVDLSVVEYELGTGSTTPWKPYNTKSIVYNNAVDDWRDSGNRKCIEPACVSPGYNLKPPKLNKPWIDRWEKCDKNGPVPCHNNWNDMIFWLQEYNKKREAWEDTGVEIDDPGCQSGSVGKFNSLNYATCTEGKADWTATGSWPKVHKMLRDVGNFDFRPHQNGDLVGKGKNNVHFETNDIGAYRSSGSHYNIPGHVETLASSPVPPNGAFSVLKNADLMFLGGLNAAKHLIYLSTSFCSVATGNAKSRQLASPSNIYTPNDLVTGLTYYWRVDTVRIDNTIEEGSVWCFDVAEDSSPETSSLSWNLRTNKSSCTIMNIEDHCGSPPSPTQSPIQSPTQSPICRDDSSFMFNGDPDKTCEWVKAKKTEKRCNQTNNDGKLVKEYCPVTCNVCNNDSTPIPTTSPTQIPTQSPTTSPICQDDPSFMFNGDPEQTCVWVKAKKTEKRCNQTNNDGKLIKEYCPITCNACNIDSTLSPTPSPTQSPTQSLVCQDDPSFMFDDDPEKTCEWVKVKTKRKRCKMIDKNNKPVKEYCPLTCGNCPLNM